MKFTFLIFFIIPIMAYSQNQVIVIKENADTVRFTITELRGHKDKKIDGKKILFDTNGVAKLIYYQKSGKPNGLYTKYFISGQIEEEGMMIEGIQIGLWFKYYQNGRINEKGCYKEGEKYGQWEYFDINGSTIKK